jgi:hypothetical protein
METGIWTFSSGLSHMLDGTPPRCVPSGRQSFLLFEIDIDIHFRCYYHFYNVSQLTGLLAAAMTLVYDLGLNRPAPREASSLFEDALRESTSNLYRPSLMRAKTLEEQRTFMGCFFLDSVYELTPLAVLKHWTPLISFRISAFFHRGDPPRPTAYLDECCKNLDKSGDHRDDRHAVSLVRLQIIQERIGQNPLFGKVESLGALPPAMLFVRALQQQLMDFKRDRVTEAEPNCESNCM